jgi:glycosyltransferase involved in cell wall biosynthesis
MASRPPYTIGYFDDGNGHGGTTRYLMELLQGLDRTVFHPVYYGFRPAWWHPQLVERNVEIVLLEPDAPSEPRAAGAGATEPASPALWKRPRLPQSVAWWLGLGADIRALRRLFRKRPMDLLHSNNTGAEPAPIAARLAGVPHILGFWHVDSSYDFGKRSSFRYRWLERRSMRALDYAIAPAQQAKDDWIARTSLGRHFDGRISIVPYAVDLDRLVRRSSQQEARAALRIPEGALAIGSLGRLEGHKGYEYLIRAMPEILRSQPRALALIGGRGPLEGELRRLAEQLGVAHAVRFLGFIGEIRDLMECLDLYVQPSLCETTGIALLEAGGMRMPLAGSSVGGIPEVIIDGETGLLFPPRDPPALAAAVLRLLGDPALRTRLGNAARERVATVFTLARMVAETMAVYRQLLDVTP